MRLIKDITGNHWQVEPCAPKSDGRAGDVPLRQCGWKKFQAAARRAAHMDGWQENPIYGKLPRIQDCVKMPPVDTSYKSFPPTAKK